MANETVTKSQRFYCVSLVPDICKTPIGPSTPPIPYSVMGEFAEAADVSPNVKSRSEPVILHQRSTIPTVKGDEPGTAGGIKSGTYGKCVETKTASATLHANGTATVQEGCEVWMNNRNTVGKIYERGGVLPRTRLQQIDAWLSDKVADATVDIRKAIAPFAQAYKDEISDSLHQFGADAMDVGSDVAMGSAVVGGAGAVVGASGFGVPVAAVMESGAVAGESIAGAVSTVGNAAEVSATVMDQIANFILTGKTPEMAQAAANTGTRLVNSAVTKKFGVFGNWWHRVTGSITPGKKSNKPRPPKPPDKPRGGKTKADKSESKSDKPSDCCPKNSAPGGKPVAGRKPIHFGTGEEVLYQTDFVLDGPQPMAWTRCYRSGSEHEDWSPFGARWSSPFTSSVLLAADGTVYVDDSGRAIQLPPLVAVGQSLDNRKEGFSLKRDSVDEFILTWRDGSTDTFKLDTSGQDSWLPHGYNGVNAMRPPGGVLHVQRYTLRRSAGRDGRGISIERYDAAAPGGLLLRVRDDNGHTLEAMRTEEPATRHLGAGRIGRVDEVREDGTRICHVRYDYAPEKLVADSSASDDFVQLPTRFNLIRQTNIAGDSRHYTYQQHLLQSCSTYGGFTSTLHWISLAALRERWSGSTADVGDLRQRFPITLTNSYQARATDSAGEDGSDALRIDYTDHDTSRITDAVGGVLEYTFDANWLAVEVRRIAPDGTAASLGRRQWDRDGMLLAEIDAAGHGTHYTYDAAGNVTGSTDALGRSSSITYNAHNQAIALTDPLGATTRLSYDEVGRLACFTDALDQTTRYRYDTHGRLTDMQDAKGGVKRIEYNKSGHLIAYTDCSGRRNTYRYDQNDHVAAAIDALENSTRYDYDAQGRVQCVTQADGTQDRYAYDADGNLLTHTDALGHVTSYGYNGHGLPTIRTDALGQTLRYSYDAALRLVELVNGNGESYRLAYDAENRLSAETGFDGKTTNYRYDGAGQLTSSDCRGIRVELIRDVCGQLLARQNADGTIRYAYDAAGRLEAVAASHAEQRYAYDALGQLIEERSAYYLTSTIGARADGERSPDASFIMSHAYDELGNRIQTVLPNGRRIDIERYGIGHWHGTLWQGQQIVAIERDGLHRERLRRIGTASKPLLAKRSYDPQSRPKTMTLRRNGDADDARPLRERRFLYDPVGNLLAIEHGWHTSDETLGNYRYAYDPIGQLLSSIQPQLTETFAFDPAGNLLDPTARPELSADTGTKTAPQEDIKLAAVTHNLLQSYLGHHYRYDAQGNVVNKRYARAGEADDSARELDLVYDTDNRLIHATRTTKWTRHTTRYFYDAFSRRIAKCVIEEKLNSDPLQSNPPVNRSESATIFVWDGDTMVQELGDDKTVTYLYEPDTFVPLARIESEGGYGAKADNIGSAEGADTHSTNAPVYLPHVTQWDFPSKRRRDQEQDAKASADDDALWLRRKADAESKTKTDQVAYFNCDHLGTPRELLSKLGEIVWMGGSKAWGGWYNNAHGQRHNSIDLEVDQPLRFQGQYEDPETGLHYNRYRYYDPDSARFFSHDPIGLLGGLNGYSYASNPTSWIDPQGLTKCLGNQPCNACDGRDPAAAARKWQGPGNAPYFGQDDYKNVVVEKGTVLYTLYPHGPAPGNYFVRSSTAIFAGNARAFNDLVQVAHNKNSAGGRDMRTRLHAYILEKDTCLAESIAKNNPTFGFGGATQLFIENKDKVNLFDTGKLFKFKK